MVSSCGLNTMYPLILRLVRRVDTVILQYGAVGVVALLSLYGMRILFRKWEALAQREQDRADRLEGELRELHKMIQTTYASTLNDATKAISDALALVRRK